MKRNIENYSDYLYGLMVWLSVNYEPLNEFSHIKSKADKDYRHEVDPFISWVLLSERVSLTYYETP